MWATDFVAAACGVAIRTEIGWNGAQLGATTALRGSGLTLRARYERAIHLFEGSRHVH